MNIPSAYRIANIALNDAMILPYNANPGRMEFSERTGPNRWGAATSASDPQTGHCLGWPASQCVSHACALKSIPAQFARSILATATVGPAAPKQLGAEHWKF